MRNLLITTLTLFALGAAACGEDTSSEDNSSEDTCTKAEDCCNDVAAILESDPNTTVTCDPIPADATESQCQSAIDLVVGVLQSSDPDATVPASCE